MPLSFRPATMWLSICIFSTHHTPAEVNLSVSENSVNLSINVDALGYEHCRVDASTDLNEWERVSAVTLNDGAGAIELMSESPEAMPDTMFFRVISDDSADNVLNLPAVPDDYETVDWPAHLAFETDNTPVGNRVTNEGALLGRVLFYDKKLSANHTVSCASVSYTHLTLPTTSRV